MGFYSFSYPANDESQAVFMFSSHFPRMANISKLKKALISVDKGEETEDGDDNCGDDDNDDESMVVLIRGFSKIALSSPYLI